MANAKISELVELIELENADQFVAVDDSEVNIAIKTKRISYESITTALTAFFQPTFDLIQLAISALQESNIFNVVVTSGNFLADKGRTYVITAASNVTLPSPSLNAALTVKRMTTDAVVVLPFASELIDGNATCDLTSLKESATFVSDGTDWYRV